MQHIHSTGGAMTRFGRHPGVKAPELALAKLAQRHRDGQGGHLDVNLLNCALALQQSSLAGRRRIAGSVGQRRALCGAQPGLRDA